MPMTSAWRKKVGDHMIGKSDIGSLADLWMGLTTSNPGDAGSMTSEIATGGYGRINVTSLFGAFDSSTGVATNSSEVNFGTPSADWGTPAYVIYCTAENGGEVKYYEQIPNPRFIAANSRPVKFSAGRLKIRHR